jgi:hypothetical protein
MQNAAWFTGGVFVFGVLSALRTEAGKASTSWLKAYCWC